MALCWSLGTWIYFKVDKERQKKGDAWAAWNLSLSKTGVHTMMLILLSVLEM